MILPPLSLISSLPLSCFPLISRHTFMAMRLRRRLSLDTICHAMLIAATPRSLLMPQQRQMRQRVRQRKENENMP